MTARFLAAGVEPLRLGLKENLAQFSLLLLINGFVGAMVGMERSVLPVLAEREFGVASRTSILSFVLTFGVVKGISNLVAGGAADRWGRKSTLVAGWLAGLPVPFMIIFAPSWPWVVAANVLLGVNQGLCWSSAVIMKVDLVGRAQRGLAIGLNEASGYLAVSLAALLSGYVAAAFGLRPYPFLIGVAAALGGLLCSLAVRETNAHVRLEAAAHPSPQANEKAFSETFRRTSWQDRSLLAVSQGGLINNLNDGVCWGLLPLYFSAAASLAESAQLVAIYPAVWALAQLGTGPLSDRFGRKPLMGAGMMVQGVALFAITLRISMTVWWPAMIALGLGTALVYPTFIGAVSDHAHPSWRASAIGVYRLWRDLGYALGAIIAGSVADRLGIPAAFQLVAAMTFISGILLIAMYREAVAAPGTSS